MFNPEMIWMSPVSLRLKDGTEHIFSTVNDALDFLEADWSMLRGRKHNRAVQACRRALNRVTPVAIAREAFIDACLDAGMSATAAEANFARPGSGGQRSVA
ncbi:DUF982 domain-containing protein [Ensifer sp.]|jgi:hypothetical protein|uniref:DUF982 domain-containing protein n=1 Tax=Ensifer sp. TaxID=1872086 RepID=UPI002897DD84|nr:DUF982 domain-containing protein [Ensifer sp.]